MNMPRRAAISGVGMYAPDNIIKNDYFDEFYKKDIGSFLEAQRNIKERRWMNKDQSTSDLILPAALSALKQAGIGASELDLIIVATDTPDYLSPSTASVIQFKLGAKNAGTFDLNSACAGFVTACDVAAKYIASDESYKNILVVGAYAMSKWLNMDDYKIASLFADGAGAVVMTPAIQTEGWMSATMYTDGQYHDYMGIYAGGSSEPITQSSVETKKHLLSFPKRIPPETNGLHWPRLTKIILQKINKTPQDVAHFFITQFNVQGIYETMDRLEVPRDRAHLIMDKYGYTGSASIGMCLADAAEKHLLKKGELIVLLGSGGGMSMAAIALEWGYDS